MAYQNAFTLGASSIKVYKSFDAGFPVVGFSLLAPASYVANGIAVSESAGIVSVDVAAPSTFSLIIAVAPSYLVGSAPARAMIFGSLGQGIDTTGFEAIKADNPALLQYNQSTLVWSGTTHQIVEVVASVFEGEEENELLIVPNPVLVENVEQWSDAGYLIKDDGPLNVTFTFTLEIDGVVAVSCFWQDVVGATQNCIPA